MICSTRVSTRSLLSPVRDFFGYDIRLDTNEGERDGVSRIAFQVGDARLLWDDQRSIDLVHLCADLQLLHVTQEHERLAGAGGEGIFAGSDIDLQNSAGAWCADSQPVQQDLCFLSLRDDLFQRRLKSAQGAFCHFRGIPGAFHVVFADGAAVPHGLQAPELRVEIADSIFLFFDLGLCRWNRRLTSHQLRAKVAVI